MAKTGKDESKAVGGNTRARVLSPERRKEIAQAAAASRWANNPKKEAKVRPPKTVAPGPKSKRVLAARHLSIVSSYPAETPGVKTAAVVENSNVVRTIRGAYDLVDERVQGYLAALQDLGIEVTVTYSGDSRPSYPLEEAPASGSTPY